MTRLRIYKYEYSINVQIHAKHIIKSLFAFYRKKFENKLAFLPNSSNCNSYHEFQLKYKTLSYLNSQRNLLSIRMILNLYKNVFFCNIKNKFLLF